MSNPILEAPNPTIADPLPAHFRRASKVDLAKALWPSLEDRIRTSPTTEAIPIVGVIREAIDMMHEVDGVNAMAPHRTPAS